MDPSNQKNWKLSDCPSNQQISETQLNDVITERYDVMVKNYDARSEVFEKPRNNKILLLNRFLNDQRRIGTYHESI